MKLLFFVIKGGGGGGGWPNSPGQYRGQYPPQNAPQQWQGPQRPGGPPNQGPGNQWDQNRYPGNQQYGQHPPVSTLEFTLIYRD